MADAPQNNPLEFVTTEEMVNELGRRFPGVVLTLLSDEGEHGEGFQVWIRGGSTLALGMLARASAKLVAVPPDHVEDVEGD
jgi:hypothetical protein